MLTLNFHPAAGKSMASSFLFLSPALSLHVLAANQKVLDWEMEQHWGLHHEQSPASTSQLSFGWMALQGSGQQLQQWLALPGAWLMAFSSGRVGWIHSLLCSVRAQGWVCCLFWLN